MDPTAKAPLDYAASAEPWMVDCVCVRCDEPIEEGDAVWFDSEPGCIRVDHARCHPERKP